MLAFGRYLVSAGAATCVDVALVQLLLAFHFASTPFLFALAVIAGALCGMGVNFSISRHFVFARGERPVRQQIVSFFMICMTIIVLRLLVAFGLVALFSLPLFGWMGALPVDAPVERAAHIGAVGLVTIYSFLAHKHVTFAGGFGALFSRRSAVRP